MRISSASMSAALCGCLFSNLGCGGDSATAPGNAGPRPLEVASTREMGILTQPAAVVGRDGGSSALVGGRVLWTFGDTFYSRMSADGTNFRSNTAALSDPASPVATTEPLDGNGTPAQAVPFTAEEKAYNDSTGRPDNRIALWVGSVVNDVDGSGLAFVSKLYVRPGLLNYEDIGIALARFAPGRTTADRYLGLLFRENEPGFSNAFVHEGQVYAFGPMRGANRRQYAVARAPLNQARERAAYRFFSGTDWVADVAGAVGVMRDIPGVVSVSYNAHLRQFLAVHSAPLSSRVVMRSAPRPEGPWSEPLDMFTGMPPTSTGGLGVDYAGVEHPELAAEGGRRVFVSYHRPLAAFLSGEMRLVEVTFR